MLHRNVTPKERLTSLAYDGRLVSKRTAELTQLEVAGYPIGLKVLSVQRHVDQQHPEITRKCCSPRGMTLALNTRRRRSRGCRARPAADTGPFGHAPVNLPRPASRLGPVRRDPRLSTEEIADAALS